MGDTEDDARYPPRQYVNHRSAYQSTSRTNPSIRNPPYQINNNYRDEDDYEDGYEMEEEEEDEPNSEEDEAGNGYKQKKRKLESLVNNYEFVARKPQQNVRISPADWTEQATSELLEAWGDRFLELGRKSLRSEDWQELAEKVSDSTKVDWTESQCRNRLDTLKKKYKKEKARMDENFSNGYNSKWGFFKKMDMLLNPSVRQQGGLPCGVDTGEYVFMNSKVYLNRSNGLDEMRDSPGESDASEEEEGSAGSKRRNGEADGTSFRLLADSIQKFGDIYEKIESSKRQQMVELEKMRMDFQRDLEAQKKQILERAQAEIANIRQQQEEDGDDDDDEEDEDDDDDATDGSAQNHNG
ncbi:trihelix transcription factor ASIL1 [Impatiens glandulifera]|uniref:trihelix transcription factor ASIL1 n=1 Tax=Impatiens glandulifera TaxID=253017 RepID=UPI001FB131D4|nr:trihelix transcription factor ASIL1 [Impatiens glandulifera]